MWKACPAFILPISCNAVNHSPGLTHHCDLERSSAGRWKTCKSMSQLDCDTFPGWYSSPEVLSHQQMNLEESPTLVYFLNTFFLAEFHFPTRTRRYKAKKNIEKHSTEVWRRPWINSAFLTILFVLVVTRLSLDKCFKYPLPCTGTNESATILLLSSTLLLCVLEIILMRTSIELFLGILMMALRIVSNFSIFALAMNNHCTQFFSSCDRWWWLTPRATPPPARSRTWGLF